MDKIKDAIRAVILKPNVTLENIDAARIIRVKSARYNLLIMRDHSPIIGEIDDGAIWIEADELHEFKFTKGFFSFSHNLLRLIIIDEDNDARKV